MIDSFRGEYRFLSNFYSVQITYQGMHFPSTEHAYQAMKCELMEDRIRISKLATEGKVKWAGNDPDLVMRSCWNEIKDQVMYDVCWLKFQQPELRQKLLDTGDATLIEGNTWGDTYWGVCNGVGQNKLGRILMRIRNEIRLFDYA